MQEHSPESGTDAGSGLLIWLEAKSRHPHWRLTVLGLAFAAAVVVGLGSIGPWGARERRLSACVADMVNGGQWLIPHLWGRLRLEKPPLPYWLCASSAVLTGRLNEWTLRLPGLLAVLLVLITVYRLGSDAGGPSVGTLASLFLLSSIYCVTELRKQSNDLYLTAFTSAGLWCWWQGYKHPAARQWWWPAAGLCGGLAFNCKGPVTLAVMMPPIVGLMWAEGALHLPRRPVALASVAVFLLVSAVWPAATLCYVPDAWITWLQELDWKIAQGTGNPERGWWFYLLQWPQYLFPWCVFAVGAVRYGLIRRGQSVPSAVRFCWFWFFGNMLLFSIVRSRKVYYLLPAIPGLAVLAAYAVQVTGLKIRCGAAGSLRRWAVHFQLGLLTATWLLLAAVGWHLRAQVGWLGASTALLLAAACVAVHVGYVRSGSLVGSCMAGSLCFVAGTGVCWAVMLPAIDGQRSARHFAAEVSQLVPAEEPLFFWGEPDPSLWFYLQRPLRPLSDDLHTFGSQERKYVVVRQQDLGRLPVPSPRLRLLTGPTSDSTVLVRVAGPDGEVAAGRSAGAAAVSRSGN